MALEGFPVPFLSPEISVSFRLFVAVGGLEPPLIADFEASPFRVGFSFMPVAPFTGLSLPCVTAYGLAPSLLVG